MKQEGCDMSCLSRQLFDILLDRDSGEVRSVLDLKEFSEKTGVNLTRAVIREICKLYRCNKHVKLRVLDLSSCLTQDGSDSHVLDIFSNCGSKLEKILLSDCFISHVGLRSLSIHCSKTLRILDFSGCQDCMDDKNLRIVASFGRTLESLELSGCRKLSNDGICELVRVCIRLKHLGLNQCKRIGNRACRDISQYCSLSMISLNLSGCLNVDDGGLTTIMKRCEPLESLRISNNALLSGKWTKAINYKNLKRLQLSSCHKMETEAFSRISQFTCLEELDISGNPTFNFHNLSLILQNCCNILSLNLKECRNVDDCFMKAISCDCKQLIELNIVNCVRITSKGLERIILSCIEVSFINCSGCDNISSEFLKDQVSKLDFSDLVITNCFVGFMQKKDAVNLRYLRRIKRKRDVYSTDIQKMYRSYISRQRITKHMRANYIIAKAVPRIQAYLRGKRQRKYWRILLDNREKEAAAICLQSFWRMQLCESVLVKLLKLCSLKVLQSNSALLIQSQYRSFRCTLIFKRLRHEKVKQSELEYHRHRVFVKAAITVQNLIRRLQSERLLRFMKKESQRRSVEHELGNVSLIRLQLWLRRIFALKIYEEIKQERMIERAKIFVTLVIQSYYRKMKAILLVHRRQEHLLHVIKSEAASSIQRLIRYHFYQRSLRIKRDQKRFHSIQFACAILIQSFFRFCLARVKVQSILTLKRQEEQRIHGSINIQRIFRGYLGRAKYFFEIEINHSKHEIQPFTAALSHKTLDLERLYSALGKAQSLLRSRKKENESLRSDLLKLKDNPSSHVDSMRVNSFLQRHKSSALKETLTKSLVRANENLKLLQINEEKLLTDVRVREREIRKLIRKLASVQDTIMLRARVNYRKVISNENTS